MSGATRALADAVRNLRFEDLPEEAIEAGRHCLLDALGCGIGGAAEPLVDILVDNVVQPEGSGGARLIGRVEHASPLTAALVNGAAAHALDYDDTHMRMSGHPSVPVLPALCAIAENEELSGAQLLTALIAGIEVEARLGALMNPEHYAVGFHATGTLGTVGAAAAASHALGLDVDGFCHALGLGATLAAGLKASFGSMAKPLHAGRAAQSGLLAATLARGGFTGNPEVVEANQGFAAAFHGSGADADALLRYDGRFLVRDTLFKYHAACYLTHSAIEATNALRADGLLPDDVERIEIRVAPDLLDVCAIPEPQTGLEGKFSLRGTVAMALLGVDTSDLRAYTDEQVRAPDYVALRDKATVTTAPGMATTEGTVVIEAAGKRWEASHDAGVPAKDLGDQWDRLGRKFRSMVDPVVGRTKGEALHGAVARVEELPSARELVDLARPAME